MSDYDRWLKVNDDKNSKCDSSLLKDLDWSYWYSDDFFSPIYLHVGRKSDKTTHRIFPRKKRGQTIVGLALKENELYWIFNLKANQ